MNADFEMHHVFMSKIAPTCQKLYTIIKLILSHADFKWQEANIINACSILTFMDHTSVIYLYA